MVVVWNSCAAYADTTGVGTMGADTTGAINRAPTQRAMNCIMGVICCGVGIM